MTFVLAALGLGAIFGVALIVSSLREGRRAEASLAPIPVESDPRPIVRRQGR
jgi:hypothetical protein